IKFKSVEERVVEATGVSLSSVRHIKNELQDIVSGKSVSFSIQHKERPRRSRKAAIDTFNEAVICHTMNDFYIVEKERPTVSRQVLVAQNNIRSQRIAYLRAIRRYRQENRPIIYMNYIVFTLLIQHHMQGLMTQFRGSSVQFLKETNYRNNYSRWQ
ncbi:hypothetical protein C0J52_26450, partial [Blattella germanica]